MIRVTYFYREPRKTGTSIEGIFRSVRECLKGQAEITEVYCEPGLSRLQNTRRAGRLAGNVNHITGDVNFLALGMRGRKNILTIHDFGFYENPVHSRLVKMVYRMFWFYLPFKCVDRITVVSQFTKQKLLQYFRFPESRVRVIPDPVKPFFTYAPRTRRNEKPVVLMMGTGKHKNLDNLIEAAKGAGFHLDIIGWPAPDELERLNGYGISYKVYNGLTDAEVQERYAACDIMFMASLYEGFGMPIIEAQTVGRAVVTSNIGAMKEVGEGSALLVNPHDPAAIRQAIESLYDPKLYDEVVSRGRANAAKYSCDAIARQYLDVYRELCGD